MTSTVLETLDVNFNDNTFPILCNDTADGVVGIDTDFVFDAMNPFCYSGGALPSVSGTIPTAGLVNLAPDAQPFLSRTAAAAVTAVPRDTSKLPIFDGKGLVFLAGIYESLRLLKGNTAENRVGEPSLEGFKQSLITICYRASAFGENMSPMFLGQWGSSAQSYGGFIVNASANRLFYPPGTVISTVTAGVLEHLAVLLTYDTGAGTTTVTPFINGAAQANLSGTAPASIAVNNTNATPRLGAAGSNTLNGIVYRATRHWPGLSGRTPADIVAADYAYCKAKFA